MGEDAKKAPVVSDLASGNVALDATAKVRLRGSRSRSSSDRLVAFFNSPGAGRCTYPYVAQEEENVTEAVQQKKSGVFGFLKDLVAEEVPDKPAARATPVPAAAQAPQHFSAPPAGQPAQPDPAALAKLEQRLQGACPPAYVQFMEQYETLKDVIPDEGTRFKAALKTSHTTPDQIVAALDQLLASMDTAHTDFTHSFETSKAKKLGEAEQSIKATDELIKSSEEQIKAIEEKIVSYRTKRATDAEGMANEAGRLEAVRGGFEAAHAQVIGRLSAQKNRITSMPKA
jgi:hypothetical protein